MEKHVTSLELSKRLKELGVKQKLLFWHELNNIDGGIGTGEIVYSKDMSVPVYYSYGYVSSFLASELGEMLPERLFDRYHLNISRIHNVWVVQYSYGLEIEVTSQADTLVNAIAKATIYLLEQGIINVEDINK